MKTQTSNEQLSLFDLAPSPTPVDNIPPSCNLFLAVFPDHYAAQRIAEIGMTLRRKRNLWNKMRPTNHLHVSLHSLNRLENAKRKIGPVCEAVAAATPQFEIKFNSIMSFRGGRFGKNPLVLVGNARGNDNVKRLHGSLRTEFGTHGSPTGLASRLTPHVTLLYEQLELPLEQVEPVSWIVKEIVLVASEVGETKYHFLGRWPLSG